MNMQVVHTLAELREALAKLPRPFGLVPTMGFLHNGHIALVNRAARECASVGVSIFVNPTQFGPQEDFSRYPRNLPRDLELLSAAGAAIVWAPSPEEVYPVGFQTYVSVEEISLPLEGKARPGHFRGVATVVSKLFLAFQPDRAYFGQKDAQQVAVIQRMARDLNFPLEIVVCPTLREPDGLAMSSRNSYLNPEERAAATVLYRALQKGKDSMQRGEKSGEIVRRVMQEVISSEPKAKLEYASAADPDTLQELALIGDRVLLSLAVRVGQTRLIDNFLCRDGKWDVGILNEKQEIEKT